MKETTRQYVEEKLLSNYQKYYRLAYSYVGNEADALDIVQESAYKAIKNCSGLKKRQYADSWIYRIVINTAKDFLRKGQKERGETEEYPEQPVSEEGYAEADIMATLSVLEEKERSVVILRYFDDFKLEEIADVTGENISTVKSRLYRALKKLRINLEER